MPFCRDALILSRMRSPVTSRSNCEREEDLERQPPHRGRGVERLGNGDEGDKAVALALDTKLFSAAAGDTTAPAELLAGVAPITGSAGNDQTAMITGLRALIAAGSPVAGGQIGFAMHPLQAAALWIMAPSFAFPTFVSGHIMEGRVIALALPALVAGVGAVDFTASRETLVHMSDTPAEIVSTVPATADPVVSGYQQDLLALRVLLDVSWRLRPATGSAVAWIDGATW
jgi:hypothetical protein